MAYQNSKFWKYVVKKRSFIMGNQSKYYLQFFCIDEVAREVTCATSVKAKDIVDRFPFQEINQVFNSAVPEEDCPAPTAFGFSISNGVDKVWNIFCDVEAEQDDWVAKLSNIQSKMQKIRQLSLGSSGSALISGIMTENQPSPGTPPRQMSKGSESDSRGSFQQRDSSFRESTAERDTESSAAKPRRRRSSVTFNFDEIDGSKKKPKEAEIAGANPMKSGDLQRLSVDHGTESRPEIVKRMTVMNSIGKPHISITGSNRIKKLNKRSSEPAPLQSQSATDSAAALSRAVAADMATTPANIGPPTGPPPAAAQSTPPRGPPPAGAKKGGPPSGPPPTGKGGPPVGPPPTGKGGPPRGPPPASSKGGPPSAPPPPVAAKAAPPSRAPPAGQPPRGAPPAAKVPAVAAAAPAKVPATTNVSGPPPPPPPPKKHAVQQENIDTTSTNTNAPPAAPKSSGTVLPPPPQMKKPVQLPAPPKLTANIPVPPVPSGQTKVPALHSISGVRPPSSVPNRRTASSAGRTGTRAPPPPPPPLDD